MSPQVKALNKGMKQPNLRNMGANVKTFNANSFAMKAANSKFNANLKMNNTTVISKDKNFNTTKHSSSITSGQADLKSKEASTPFKRAENIEQSAKARL